MSAITHIVSSPIWVIKVCTSSFTTFWRLESRPHKHYLLSLATLSSRIGKVWLYSWLAPRIWRQIWQTKKRNEKVGPVCSDCRSTFDRRLAPRTWKLQTSLEDWDCCLDTFQRVLRYLQHHQYTHFWLVHRTITWINRHPHHRKATRNALPNKSALWNGVENSATSLLKSDWIK